MIRFLRILLKTALILAIAGIPGYYFLVLHSPVPSQPGFAIDIASIRTLAQKVPGAKPAEIRVEKIAELQFAEAMVMAGEPWKATPIPVYSYQLMYPDRSIVVDTAMANTDGVPDFMVNAFHPGALQRMYAAMDIADAIIITHEHFDHIAGLFSHPRLGQILPAVKLTTEQLSFPDRMAPAEIPDAEFSGYEPLYYDDAHALAPGVVLVKAAGHTPGSQMVYIQLANGAEVLLLGDVAWQMRNIRYVRERPLFMTAMIKEDRTRVINQFGALNRLMQQEPGVHLLPGHELRPVADLVEKGILRRGFRVTAGPS